MAIGELTLFNKADEVDVMDRIVKQIEERTLEPTSNEVIQAVSIIQHHLEKEARNRQATMLFPEDLCPAQKRDMVRDLMRLFRS